MTAAAERACLAAAQPPAETTGDLARLVALDVARIAETYAMPATARATLCAREPQHWHAVATAFAAHDGPLPCAALDAAMLLARGKTVAAADALAIARGQTLRQWCETMRGVSP